jgi:hypothetical protein
MVELVNLSHTISLRCERPQKDQHAGPLSEEIRMEILQLIGILIRCVG